MFQHVAGNVKKKHIQEVDKDYFTSTDEPELEFDDDGTELSTKEGKYTTSSNVDIFKQLLLL